MANKYFKTTFVIEVLSEDSPIDGDVTLTQLDYLINEGDCSGLIHTPTVIELSAEEVAKELIAQGSDPEFFGLDEDGTIVVDD
jgi:hypothetical protein